MKKFEKHCFNGTFKCMQYMQVILHFLQNCIQVTGPSCFKFKVVLEVVSRNVRSPGGFTERKINKTWPRFSNSCARVTKACARVTKAWPRFVCVWAFVYDSIVRSGALRQDYSTSRLRLNEFLSLGNTHITMENQICVNYCSW